jgi:hypothetical protein
MLTTPPLLKFLFGPSLVEELLEGCDSLEYPAHFTPVPDSFLRKFGVGFFRIIRPKRFLPVQITRNVRVSPEGRVFAGWKISRCSDLYPLLQPRWAFEWLRSRRKGPAVAHFKNAWFVPIQVIKSGSYGDYWDEYFTAISFHRPPPGSKVLLPPHYAARFARIDLEALGLEVIDLKDGEVSVETLHVVPPCQFFDNFLPETTAAIRDTFADRVSHASRVPGHKVYLSRVGFARPAGAFCAGTERFFENEAEVEEVLRQRGFSILRTHETTNEGARQALAGADVVVAAHGASMFHTLWSPPRALVEIATLDWFLPTFSKFAVALDIPSYSLVEAPGSNIDINALVRTLDQVGG